MDGRQNPAASRRLLVINPNTNAAVTELVRRAAARAVSPETETVTVNPERGPFAIETAADRGEAIPQIIALMRDGVARGFDGYVLACFDDIALDEARALARGPVVGACEAGFAAAQALGQPFAVVTTVQAAVPVIAALAERYGVTDRCRVRAAGLGVAAAAGDSPAAEALIAAAVRTALGEGAQAILLGSGGFTGRAEGLARQFAVPVIDAVAAAVARAEVLVRRISLT